jgi:hypothetical protein
VALADFGRRRGRERLGHASLFAFLARELALSNGAAWLRLSAARLLPRIPAVEAALRQGRLCRSAVGELSRVITVVNAEEVLPRYFGRSAREAREVAAAICPTRRRPGGRWSRASPLPGPASSVPPSASIAAPRDGCQLRAHEVAPPQPAREVQCTVEPLKADLRRLHLPGRARSRRLAGARGTIDRSQPPLRPRGPQQARRRTGARTGAGECETAASALVVSMRPPSEA